ncbi:MAG TPA: ABC transporter permease [Bacteroidales bacterium]|nr:ABC transporter permease [Bacteroidales bacterium]
MIRNYFIIALRNFRKHKFFGFINVTGLSIGITCALLITLFVIDELGYDKYNTKRDRIYRLISHIKYGGNDAHYAVCPAPLGNAIREEIPEIEDAARFRGWGMFLVKKEKENYKEFDAIWADPNVFNIFTIPLLKGNRNTILTEPNTMVISQSAARKYFGEEDPMNKTLVLNGNMLYTITGVYKDIPHNSHFHFSMMLAMSGLEESKNNSWLSNNFQTYFLLKEGADPMIVKKKINELIYKYAAPQVVAFTGKTIPELISQGTIFEEIPERLLDIHLKSNAQVQFEANGDIRYVYIFSAVVIFILLLAIVNFVNLSTARSADRAREVGIRKVMGSERRYLVMQFLAESVLVTMIAVLVGILLAKLMMPYFNSLSGKSLQLPSGNILFWLLVILLGLLSGLLAGIYPALVLSSFKPVTHLSGKIASGSRSAIIRSILVIFQFTISTILIFGTITVYNQMNYISHFKLGYNKDQVIIVDASSINPNQARAYREEVLKDPSVVSATISGFLPVSNTNRNNTTYWKKGDRSPSASVNMQTWPVDHEYIKTLGMKIVAGRDFSKEFPSDSSSIILNERAAKLFGFKNPIGEEVQVFEGTPDNTIDEKKIKTLRIIGIVQNFNWESLHTDIGSLSMYLGESNDRISFRFNPEETKHALKVMEDKWREINPDYPFDYTFMDQSFAQMYAAESRTGRIITSFAVLAILIACLGLFALAAFITEQRSKEIGIRKVMGASERNIIVLFSREFTYLVLIAFLLSLPVVIYGINLWLRGFVYKQHPGLLHFAAVGAGVLLIAWLTVAFQSFRAAASNPVDSLKSE